VGRFQQLFELAIFAEWLFYMIAASTIFVHRRRAIQESHARGIAATFRMWGYPVLPALFITAAAVLLVYSYQSNLRNSLLGSAIILAGVPLFYAFRRKATR
jgi:APA family basic amino acid/polyamine antiporter